MSGATPAADLRFMQIGVLALRINDLQIDAICAELERRVQQAPELLGGAALILDLDRLDTGIDNIDALQTLSSSLKQKGFALIGLREGSAARQLGPALQLPILGSGSELRGEAGGSAAANEAAVSPPSEAMAAMHVERPVRSGQQIYARGSDLVIEGSVSAGAEVIADGSIHIYGSLRGRALAGARGNPLARVYSLDFHAELVSVAGHYKVFEELPEALRGGRVHAWLDGEQLRLAKLG